MIALECGRGCEMGSQARTFEVWRHGLAALAMLATAGLAACGQAGGNTASGNSASGASSPGVDAASVNAAFDRSASASCLTAAEAKGAMRALAQSYCSCVLVQLDKLTVAQKLALNDNSPELQQAATACGAQGATADAPAANTAPP